MMKPWMLYGATGYTGQLLAQEAILQGHRPILAGRNELKLKLMADKLHLPYIAVPLEDTHSLKRAVGQVGLVFHAAGPFVRTSRPMVDACLETGAHYLDITGELPVFQEVFQRRDEAEKRGVALMSGMGFDVIPTDCLAKFVSEKIARPEKLVIAIDAVGTVSSGTAKSAWGMAPLGTHELRQGKLIRVPFGKDVRSFEFTHRKAKALQAPLGDLLTAFHSTGIPNIQTFVAFPSKIVDSFHYTWPATELLFPLLKKVFESSWVMRKADAFLDEKVHGADEERRRRGRSFVYAQVTGKGESAEAWLETLEAYTLTAKAGVLAVSRVLEAQPRGAFAPSEVLGKDFILQIPNTRRLDSLA